MESIVQYYSQQIIELKLALIFWVWTFSMIPLAYKQWKDSKVRNKKML